MPGEASDVHLVNNGSRGGPLEGSIALPIVRPGVDHDLLHRGAGIVALTLRCLAAIVLGDNDALSVWVQQNLGRVKTHAGGGIEAALGTVRVKLAGLHTGQKHMPVVMSAVSRLIDRNNACRVWIIFAIKEQQLDARSASRKDAEIDATRSDCGAQRGAAPPIYKRTRRGGGLSKSKSRIEGNGAHDPALLKDPFGAVGYELCRAVRRVTVKSTCGGQ